MPLSLQAVVPAGCAPSLPPSVEQAFAALVGKAAFLCLGAKASRARGQLHTVRAGDITRPGGDAATARRLQALSEPGPGALFVSVAVLFPDSPPLSEEAFEQALWERLRAIHEYDRHQYAWDTHVSSDPASPDFSMSVGGQAFYIVGMHSGASRPARRFRCPAMVFNLHSQFEQLRADGRYAKLRAAILQRDAKYAGSINPMLCEHGTRSEAGQYSGRQVSYEWRCPFSPRHGDSCA